MPNYYTQFSASLRLDSADEEAWCRKMLYKLEHTAEDGHTVPLAEPDDIPDLPRYESCADFDYGVMVVQGERLLCFSSEEAGSVDSVALFVQMYLKQFHPDQCWSISWANTCSRQEDNAFGGGALFVTAEIIDSIETYTWVQSKIKDYQKELR